jgi:hypothetical protein
MGAQKDRKFFTNPIELTILLGVGAIFVFSTYQLLKSDAGEALFGLKPKGGRSIASATAGNSSLLGELSLGCQAPAETDSVPASWPKVKLNLEYCDSSLTKAQISNITVPYTASVFLNAERRTFSTDYVPLGYGENKIEVKRIHKDGFTSVHTFKLVREK